MYTGRTIFSQLMDFLPRDEFYRCVRRYNGNHKIKTFSCLDQYLCMVFAQLTGRESLRDIEACLRTFAPKLYHAGFRCKRISRNTLANANRVRPWRIYADFAQHLIAQATELYADTDLGSLRDDARYERLRQRLILSDETQIKLAKYGWPFAQ